MLSVGTLDWRISADEMLSVDALDWRISADEMSDTDKPHYFRGHIAIRTAENVTIIDSTGSEIHRYEIPKQLRGQTFSLYQTSDETALFHGRHCSLRGRARHDLFWTDRQGKVLRSKKLTLGRPTLTDSPRFEIGLTTAIVPVPAVMTPVGILTVARQLADAEEAPDFASALAPATSEIWPVLLAVNLLGAAAAVWCYRRERQFGTARVWVVFVYLFGVPGIAGYLLHRRWPVRRPCPKCQQSVPRDREFCFSCNEPFPAPARKGTEVLV